jgi:hypothetical protein
LPDEKIEDWADRVQQLAVLAFPDWPEQHMFKQAIKRICHGCIDKEAGQHVVNLNLTSIEMVVDQIKSYQCNHKSIFSRGHHPRREVREVSISPQDNSVDSDDQCRIDSLQKEMIDLKDGIRQLLKQVESTNLESQILGGRPSSHSQRECFRCYDTGHFARDCPTRKEVNRPAKHVHWSPSLNEKGSGQQA